MKLSRFAVFLLASCLAASAATITYDANTTLGGNPIDATATFVTNDNGTLDITLTDLQANPTTVAQLISDLDFKLSNGATSGTLHSSSGQEITVNSDGTFSLGSTVATGWALNSISGGLQLDVLGTTTAPRHLIIGPPGGATYHDKTGAGSIAGNGPHNPFLDGTAMFTLDVPGVTSATTVTSAIFSFGTSSDCDLCTAPGTPRNNPTVPEPGTYVMIAVGLGLVGLAQLRRSKATR